MCVTVSGVRGGQTRGASVEGGSAPGRFEEVGACSRMDTMGIGHHRFGGRCLVFAPVLGVCVPTQSEVYKQTRNLLSRYSDASRVPTSSVTLTDTLGYTDFLEQILNETRGKAAQAPRDQKPNGHQTKCLSRGGFTRRRGWYPVTQTLTGDSGPRSTGP